ncbi:MAG: hypothetical protein ABSF63_12045 [Candidatus Bathyarchaeia archaeon]
MRTRQCLYRRRYAIALFALGMIILVSAEAVSNVQATPSVNFDPSNGIPGTLVTVTLSGYDSSDTSCTISGGAVYNPTSCSLSGGSGTLTFTVKQYTASGSYIITVTGNPQGDSAQTSFQVNGLSISLNPTSGPVGTEVSFTISSENVPTNDTSCSVSGPTGNFVTLSACVVNNGEGSGTFIVGNVPPGDYVVEVTACTGNTGCSPSAGDFAQQVFTVTGGPTITINPSNGVSGTDISVSGTGFALSDQSCSITSPSNPNVVENSGCAVTSGTEGIHGSFVVGNVPSGQYDIEVTGCSGNNPCSPSQGDFAEQVLTVAGTSSPSIVLNAVSSTPGTTIQVSGSGFSSSDTSCSLSGSAVGYSTCSISGGTLSGSFVVANVATGYYTVNAIGSTGDSASATFGVGPSTAPAVPGFPIEAILSGLLLGIVIVAVFRRRSFNRTTITG